MAYPTLFLNYCKTIALKLTSLRKAILFILWNTEKPLKAYDILNQLLEIKLNTKPPTIYRVLDYFVERGVVHKIESIQSYTLCHQPKRYHAAEVLFVCDNCHQVNELYDQTIHDLVYKLAQNNHFALGQDAIELKGVCTKCQ